MGATLRLRTVHVHQTVDVPELVPTRPRYMKLQPQSYPPERTQPHCGHHRDIPQEAPARYSIGSVHLTPMAQETYAPPVTRITGSCSFGLHN